MASSQGTPPETLHDVLSTPLARLSLPAQLMLSQNLPPGEPSNALKLTVEVDPRRGLSAMYNTTPLFNQRVLEFMSTRFPNPQLSSLPSEASELDVPPQTLRKFTASFQHPIQRVGFALEFGVLGAARAILTSVYRRQFLKQGTLEPVNREPFHPYANEGNGAQTTASQDEKQEQELNASQGVTQPPTPASSSQGADDSEEFQWGLYPANFVKDPEQTIGMLSWSSEPLKDPSVLTEADLAATLSGPAKEVDCRVIFFTFGSWEVNDADFRAFATQRTMRNRVPVRGVVKRYPSPGDRMWGLIYDRCHRAKCRWFVVTTHDNWSFGVFSREWTTAFLSEPISYNVSPSSSSSPTVLQAVIYWILSSMGMEGCWDIDEPLNEKDNTAPRIGPTWTVTPISMRPFPTTPPPSMVTGYVSSASSFAGGDAVSRHGDSRSEVEDFLGGGSQFGTEDGTERAFPMMANPAPPPSSLFVPKVDLYRRNRPSEDRNTEMFPIVSPYADDGGKAGEMREGFERAVVDRKGKGKAVDV